MYGHPDFCYSAIESHLIPEHQYTLRSGKREEGSGTLNMANSNVLEIAREVTGELDRCLAKGQRKIMLCEYSSWLEGSAIT